MADTALLNYLEGFISEARKQRFNQVLSFRTRYLTVAVEDVFQLHNTSAVLRSCEVFGIQDLYLIEKRFGCRLDRKIAMGAQQWVDIHPCANAEACLSVLKEKGYRLVATTPDPSASSLEDFNFDSPAALFFGTEKEGLSQAVLSAADSRLHIPMVGFTESLNISVAASIVLYSLCSRLRQTDVAWQLSETETERIRLDWTKKSIKNVQGIIHRYYETRD